MSSEGNFPQFGIVVPEDGDSSDSMNTLAHAVLDDVLYNLIHDIVLKTHREEKIARANTAAIIVEQVAAQPIIEDIAEPPVSTTLQNKHTIFHTPGAVYDDGNIYVVGNPLDTTKEIRCSKCGLPRRLVPEISGAPLLDPAIEYCKRQPFVNRPGFDIYGQPQRHNGIAKNARKPKGKALAGQTQTEGGSSFDSPAPSPPKTQREPKLALPNVRCKICGLDVVVNRFAAHLSKCLGIGGRASGRAAALKINGQASGSQNGSTPPRSQRSTPLPPEKKSPQKRDAEELEGDEEDWDADSPRKKKPKKIVTKKWKSGKVTVNGKTVSKGATSDAKEKDSVKAQEVKKEDENIRLDNREVSESSQTLSSP